MKHSRVVVLPLFGWVSLNRECGRRSSSVGQMFRCGRPADRSRRAAIHTRFVITPIFCRPQIAPIYDFRGLLPLGNFSGQFFFSSAAAVIILKKSYLKLSTCRNSQFLVHSTTSSPDGGVNAGKNIETCLTRGKWEIQSYAAPLSDRIWRFENSAPKIDSH